MALEEQAYSLFSELPVHEYFYDSVDWGQVDGGSGKMMSADAPIFTPGMFSYTTASTAAATVRSRAYSDVVGDHRTERTMSAMAFLPPSALLEESLGCPQVGKSENFWSKMGLPPAATTTLDSSISPPPGLARDESRPAECKQM
jgi:hypothetical protein